MYHFKMQNSGFWGWEVAYYSLHPHKTTTENEKKKKKKKKKTNTHTKVTPNIPTGLRNHPETGYTNKFRFPFKSRQGR